MYTPRDLYVDMNRVIVRREKELSGLERAERTAKAIEILEAAVSNTPIANYVEIRANINTVSYFFIYYVENSLEENIGMANIVYEDDVPTIKLFARFNKEEGYDKKDLIDLVLASLAEKTEQRISSIEEKIKSLNVEHQEVSNKLIVINDMRLKRRDTHCISTRKEFFDHVMEEYRKDDVELSSLFFDFNIKMKKVDILETYAELQDTINGDDVVRMENGGPVDELIPAGEFEDVYEGNCKEFLERFNDGNIVDGYVFARFDGDDCLDFIF